ncbi:glycoside hydrolase family 13 protein [Alloscardovia macacae]|uniref:Alpha-amylase n=1 Tax=Alloscardovia macacae TaxID=1160091 RepID=A0A261F6C3_9BIFI|nr:glycoside hydrolase family 13 protein [Alloscardovia macacae]OZG54634.1 alpha-amylase [Alloscardovia macacae]
MTKEQQNAGLWWQNAVVYQIYPRSFADTTGSGLGDIPGITAHMDYLKKLGVDAIWLSPFYPSALADGGYDVDDYRNVDPRLGTMDDFDAMVDAAHERDIKVVVDIVPNHSSNRHEYFKAALKAGPGSPERDRYIFRDGRGENGELPPNSWESIFGGSAWERVEDGQWYLHMFAPEQPDWNWDNPDVHEEFLTTLRFWCDHGTDGFRVDVAHALKKDMNSPELDEVSPRDGATRTDGSHPLFDRNEVHEVYAEWRKLFNEYNPPRFAVAEAWVNPARQYLYASPDDLGQIFNFAFATKQWGRNNFHEAIEAGIETTERSGSTATWVMSNHDLIRHASRFALPQIPAPDQHQVAVDWLLRDGKSYTENRELGTKRSRAALLLEMALPGSAYVYQGEELGLFEVADIPWDQLEDPSAFSSHDAGKLKGRDGCRVPLPWVGADEDGSFGFSPADASEKPHLPQPAWFKDFAADVEDKDPDSMLNLYREVLRLRHELQADDHSVQWLDEDKESGLPDGADGLPGGVIAYARSNGWANVTNFSATPAELPSGRVLLTSGPLTADGKLPQDTSAWIKLD